MFITTDSNEISIPTMPLPDGNHIWSSIKLNIHVQWLYVIYTIQQEDKSGPVDIIFLTETEQLVEMSSSENIKIIEVYLVSPDYINGSTAWKMDKIKEIWKASLSIDRLSSPASIYILENNREYYHSYLTMDKNKFTRKELVFEINNSD